MPNCPQPPGVACTKIGTDGTKIGRYQDPKTKEVGFGGTYEEARQNAKDKAKIKTTNPASGCPNCKDNDPWCEFTKLVCEIGHGFQKGGEEAVGGIPMIAVAIGAIVLLVVAFK